MAMSVDLGERLESFVNEMVASGRYNSKSEVLREGLRLVQDRERLSAIDAAIESGVFDDAIKAGLADLAAGRVVSIEEARRELAARFPINSRKVDQ
jgi:antitoxin ParD1/3/4